jgi:hypothetical protein
MVAKEDRLEDAARMSPRESDNTASRDKLSPKALLMQKYLREMELPNGSDEGGEHPLLDDLAYATNSLGFILFSQSQLAAHIARKVQIGSGEGDLPEP